MTEVIVVGAGGFGREALDVARAMNAVGNERLDIIGVVDDQPSDANLTRLKVQGVRHLGAISELTNRRGTLFAIGVGSPTARASIAYSLETQGLRAATLVHPSALIGSGSEIGEGAIICAGAQVSTNVRIGRHAHINPNATIGHDSTIEDFVSINPGAVVSGDVHIQSHALIGAGAVVLQGLIVGHRSVVGASACVVRDVVGGETVKGVPAR